MVTQLPRDPRNRKLIVPLTRNEIRTAEAEAARFETGKLSLFGNPQIAVLQVPFDPADTLANALDAADLILPGRVLVQNPYRRDFYREIESAEGAFAESKFAVFTALCGYLGAKRVSIKEDKVTEIREQKNRSISAQSRVYGGGAANLRKDIENRIASSLEVQTQFHGGDPYLEGARELLANRHLSHDEWLIGLVEFRSNPKNPQKSFLLNLDLSREAHLALDVAAKITVPSCLTHVNAACASAKQERNAYTLRFEVEFP